jgi:concentrative nucleoside transporter, CNT family
LIDNLHSALGLTAFLGLAWLLSEDRRHAQLKVVLVGAALQLALAGLLLKLRVLQSAFMALNDAVLALQAATQAGTSFVFGYLGGGPQPFEETEPGASFILAFRALPLVIIISALTALLVYWRILPWIVRAFSVALERTLGVGGAVGLAAAANIFAGMVEAAVFVRPYLTRLTRSELFVVMTTGMATIAGTVLVLYATLLGGVIPNPIAHLLVASLVRTPAAISISLLMVPEREPKTSGREQVASEANGAMDAITRGTGSGLKLYLNIVAMLIVLVALVHLVNAMLGLIPELGGEPVTLQRLLGYAMAPVTWLMGIPWDEARDAGALMGIKTVLNEFLAYSTLAELPEDALNARSRLIMTYALCGFANFGSLGIMIGGLTTMAPERREDIIGLGTRSIVSGTLATLCTGAVVGMLY